jgi:putative spermidine/putrescine transport system permease protein
MVMGARSMALLSAIVVLLLGFIVAPLAVPLAMSISDTPYIKFPPEGFTLRWYGEVLADAEARTAFVFSLWLGAVVTAFSLALGTPCAMALVRHRFAGRGVVLALVLSPLVVPLLVTGVALLQFFSAMNSRAAFWHLVIGHTIICLPYVVRTVSASLVVADRRLEDAAMVLGATPWTAFRRVTWYQIRPGLFAGAIFAFIVSFDDYPVSMWLADAAHFPLPLYLYVAIERFFDPSIAAISSLMIFFALFLVFLTEKVLGINIKRIAG